MPKLTKATGLNNRSIILLFRGNHSESMTLQQEATVMAMELLEDLDKKRSDVVKGGAQMQLAVVSLQKKVNTLSNKSPEGKCLMLHKVFKVPPDNDSLELTILVILYNLAYLFHSRAIEEKNGDPADLKKAKDVYSLVKTLVIDGNLLTLDSPLFQLAVLNNLGQVYYSLGEKDAMKETFDQIADIMREQLDQVSEVDQRIFQQNLVIREVSDEQDTKWTHTS